MRKNVARLLFFTASSYLITLPLLLSTPTLPGCDLAYYLLQPAWLLTHHSLYYPDPPLAPLFFTPAAAVYAAAGLPAAILTFKLMLPFFYAVSLTLIDTYVDNPPATLLLLLLATPLTHALKQLLALAFYATLLASPTPLKAFLTASTHITGYAATLGFAVYNRDRGALAAALAATPIHLATGDLYKAAIIAAEAAAPRLLPPPGILALVLALAALNAARRPLRYENALALLLAAVSLGVPAYTSIVTGSPGVDLSVRALPYMLLPVLPAAPRTPRRAAAAAAVATLAGIFLLPPGLMALAAPSPTPAQLAELPRVARGAAVTCWWAPLVDPGLCTVRTRSPGCSGLCRVVYWNASARRWEVGVRMWGCGGARGG